MDLTQFLTFLYFSQFYRGVFVGVYERLQTECRKNNTTVTTLLKEFGISTGRISSWKNGSKPNPIEIKLFADRLNVSTEYLLTGEERTLNNQIALSADEIDFLNQYRYLNDDYKKALHATANKLLNSQKEMEAAKKIVPDLTKIEIKHSIFTVSAGVGEFLEDIKEWESWNTIIVPYSKEAIKADYALTIAGDSMLPNYKNGDIVFVRKQPAVDIGQIGIFTIEEKGYIKKFGGDKLISLNKKYNDITINSDMNYRCNGLVLGKISNFEIIKK